MLRRTPTRGGLTSRRAERLQLDRGDPGDATFTPETPKSLHSSGKAVVAAIALAASSESVAEPPLG
jgi:hypothetical protein